MMHKHGDKPACLFCSSTNSKVVDTRGSIRRRECLDCGHRQTTDECVRKPWRMRDLKHRTPHVLRQPSLI